MSSTPFLDRRSLRSGLRSMTSMNGRCILIVNGPPGTGKSHTGWLIEYLSYQLEQFKVVRIELEPGTGLDLQPDQLARQLVVKMGRPPTAIPGQAGTSQNRWVRDLCDWILYEAAQTGVKWWLVLDGFSDPDLPPATKMLIQELASSVTRAPDRERVRLVLLDFPETFPLAVRRNVHFDTLDATTVQAIGEVDVRAYFEVLYPQLNRTDTNPASVIEVATSSVMKSLDSTPARLPRLGEALYEVTNELAS